MNEIQLPVFKTYEEEAQFWDKLDTADLMPDDHGWLHFDFVILHPGVPGGSLRRRISTQPQEQILRSQQPRSE